MCLFGSFIPEKGKLCRCTHLVKHCAMVKGKERTALETDRGPRAGAGGARHKGSLVSLCFVFVSVFFVMTAIIVSRALDRCFPIPDSYF